MVWDLWNSQLKISIFESGLIRTKLMQSEKHVFWIKTLLLWSRLSGFDLTFWNWQLRKEVWQKEVNLITSCSWDEKMQLSKVTELFSMTMKPLKLKSRTNTEHFENFKQTKVKLNCDGKEISQSKFIKNPLFFSSTLFASIKILDEKKLSNIEIMNLWELKLY